MKVRNSGKGRPRGAVATKPKVRSTGLFGRFSSPELPATVGGDSGALDRVKDARGSLLKGRVEDADARRREAAVASLLQHRVEELSRAYSVRLAVVLDYTASTINDVASFRDDMDRLVNVLRGKIGGLDILPVAVRGRNDHYSSPEVVTGGVNDMEFLKSVQNVAYTMESPIGPGITETIVGDFFRGVSERIDAICYVSDQEFETGKDYHSIAVPFMARNDVAVAGLLQGERFLPSHEDNVVKTLGANGIVILRDGAEMDPILTIAEFILHKAYNRARPVAAASMPDLSSIEGGATPRQVGFLDHLRSRGVSGVGRVIQGGDRKLIGG